MRTRTVLTHGVRERSARSSATRAAIIRTATAWRLLGVTRGSRRFRRAVGVQTRASGRGADAVGGDATRTGANDASGSTFRSEAADDVRATLRNETERRAEQGRAISER